MIKKEDLGHLKVAFFLDQSLIKEKIISSKY